MAIDDTPAPGPSTPVTPAPVTPAPVTPAPVTPAPVTPTPPAVDPAASGTPPVSTAPDWATMRTAYAKGDEKLEKRLARYSSPEAVLDALLAAQNRISSGSLKSSLPDNPTPEQLADWRLENGIPSKAEEYSVALPNGLVIGETDKPLVDGFIKAAHTKNMTPDQVNETLSWYFQEQERQIEERNAADLAFRNDASEKLREEWGSEYKLNLNISHSLLQSAPEGVGEQIMSARLPDGTILGDHPGVLRWLANVAREVNPTATVVPGAGGNAAAAIESELAGITKLMGDRTSEYWKGPTAAKMQARYRDLISAQSKIR